ncbi:MAG: VF530 family protein [Pseudomonadota bacterium]|nr:VF530 family protein [Pseudomonadota bacterium]
MTDPDKQKTLSKNSDNPIEKREHPNDPLHGLSLKTIVTELEEHYGWEGLAAKIPVNCFKSNPSLKSSLTFLRKTPWAREKVEQLYIRSKQNWGKYKKS